MIFVELGWRGSRKGRANTGCSALGGSKGAHPAPGGTVQDQEGGGEGTVHKEQVQYTERLTPGGTVQDKQERGERPVQQEQLQYTDTPSADDTVQDQEGRGEGPVYQE